MKWVKAGKVDVAKLGSGATSVLTNNKQANLLATSAAKLIYMTNESKAAKYDF